MRCKQEEFTEGSIFHFYNKTQKNKLLFLEDSDFLYFLAKFKHNLNKYLAEVYAYCLMPNHFHFCLKQNSDKKIFRIFNDTLTSYALHYNSKYDYKGTLMQGKLQHKKIKSEEYLILLCKYIHHNPVKSFLVDHVDDWQYSNYLEWIGKRKGELFSIEIIENYKDDLVYYAKDLAEYAAYINEKNFIELLFD